MFWTWKGRFAPASYSVESPRNGKTATRKKKHDSQKQGTIWAMQPPDKTVTTAAAAAWPPCLYLGRWGSKVGVEGATRDDKRENSSSAMGCFTWRLASRPGRSQKVENGAWRHGWTMKDDKISHTALDRTHVVRFAVALLAPSSETNPVHIAGRGLLATRPGKRQCKEREGEETLDRIETPHRESGMAFCCCCLPTAASACISLSPLREPQAPRSVA